MSIKRQATSELNHDNWDQEDPEEHEEMGTFKTAPKEVLDKRVIITAKRRSQAASGDEPKKSAFSGFGGFNKTQPSSFDFLANLTNGNKATNGSTSTSSETTVTSSLFSSKTASPSGGSGLFGISTAGTPTKSTFATTPLQTSSPFAMPPMKSDSSGLFSGSKADSTVKSSPFKIEPVTSSTDSVTKPSASVTQVSSSPFGTSLTNSNDNKSLFSTTNTTTFKMQPTASTVKPAQNSFGSAPSNNASEKKDGNDDKKIKYYGKLKGLNESVSDWIKKHVEQTPLCILSPIFKDYEKYLKEIQEEYQGGESDETDKKDSSEKKTEVKSNATNTPPKSSGFGNNSGSSLFSSTNTTPKPSVFGSIETKTSSPPKSTFSFGINNSSTSSANTTTTTTASSGFSFGVTPSAASNTTSSPFGLATNTTASPSATPFSFGTGKPFSFSPSSIQQNTDSNKNENEEEDEPPKVEFTPISEENSVFDKKCKIFVKKDGNFTDKGVGTLYIKKIEESGKHQLLVRANTNLGTVLLNLILGSSVPTQRMGKNNVMLVCIPTPDAKPPPTPVLIRVKTGEEADELLETLNKYKT